MYKVLYGLVLAAVSLSGVQAATIMQPGTDVTFTYDDSTLYGTGTVIGNSIFFSPTTFRAESLNLEGSDQASATLNITVDVKEGSSYELTEFQLAEKGDYKLTGTSSSASAEGRLQVASNTKICGPGVLDFCLNSEIFDAGPLTTTGALTEWSASAGIDFADTAGWGSDTSVLAQIQNDLEAISTVNGESAFVQKKFEGVGLVVNPVVPVPASVWLFGSALGLLGWVRRRNKI